MACWPMNARSGSAAAQNTFSPPARPSLVQGRKSICCLAGESVVVEVKTPAAPVGLHGGGGAQRHVAVLVEVVAVGQPATVLPEDLTMPLAHHLGEVPVVGLLGDLDSGRALAPGLLQAPHDVVSLGLDEREVRRADVAVGAHHTEQVREPGDADALVGL